MANRSLHAGMLGLIEHNDVHDIRNTTMAEGPLWDTRAAHVIALSQVLCSAVLQRPAAADYLCRRRVHGVFSPSGCLSSQ